MSKIKIESDGTPGGTHVYLHGKEQVGITKIGVMLDANKPNEFPTITLSLGRTDVTDDGAAIENIATAINCAKEPFTIEIG